MTLREQNAKLRQENARLGLDLKKALEDLALLDNCEVCMYGQTGRCTAPKEQTKMTDFFSKSEVTDFLNLMKLPDGTSVVPDGMMKYLMAYGFFTAPASSKSHGNYEGGLFKHSYMVTKSLLTLTQDNHLRWLKARSPFIVGMVHDLCKIDQYRHPVMGHIEEFNGGRTPIYDEQAWEYNPDTLLKGHGDKSVILLSQFYTLTEEEIMCIRYHMGAFTDKSEWNDYTRAVSQYPNVLWTHQADMLASHVTGV